MSQSWHEKMIAAFPEWQVEDFAGGNFAILRDYHDKQGNPVLVMIGEDIAYVIRHESEDRYVTLAEWEEKHVAAHRTGEAFVYDQAKLAVPVVVKGDDGLFELATASTLFDHKEQEDIVHHVHRFLEEYDRTGGFTS